jgi:hypothetical protein
MYTIINDPAHGWLTVPLGEINELGIADKISGHSYIDLNKGVAHLEEDCDAPRFMRAKGVDIGDRDAGIKWIQENTTEVYHDSVDHGCYPHPVRNCPEFTAFSFDYMIEFAMPIVAGPQS